MKTLTKTDWLERPTFIMAHPDDEVLFGHAIKASRGRAHILIATDGEASTIDNNGDCFCP